MRNESVSIGGVHVYTEWGIIMTAAEIQPPEADIIRIDVPGRDGGVDITENLYGRTPYKNRIINMHFEAPDEETWPVKYSEILQQIHGQTKNIIFDADLEYFYTGRCVVSGFSRGKGKVSFDIQSNAEPYKHLVSDPDYGVL